MWDRAILATLFVAMALAGAPAHACITSVPIELADIEYADVVVVGRIDNYKVVLDPIARQEFFANYPDTPPDLRESLESKPSFISDYSMFDVLVDEVLIGKSPQTLTVTWVNSTFAEPETMPSGPFLIALRHPGSRMPPFRSSGIVVPSPETDFLTVLQAPCSSAFIFAAESKEADAIRQMLNR